MDWTKASIELAAPLSNTAVKKREQGGRKVSYIEGWHAIAEANRIFGFDGWTRETVDIRMVAQAERKIGKTNPRDGWGVSYTAKVRVTAGGIAREGVGAGHGIDIDLGQAHESAIKEAETDAMKRALMTFGNPFGLALYDKEQTNVSNGETPEPTPAQEARFIYERLVNTMNSTKTIATLDDWIEKHKDEGEKLPSNWYSLLVNAIKAHRAELAPKANGTLSQRAIDPRGEAPF